MPAISYTTKMNAPRSRVWEFVKDMDNWAPFVQGYQSHEKINDRESIWTVKGEIGLMSRVTRAHVIITEWVEGERVAFTTEGLNEPITGSGAIDISDGDTPDETVIRGDASLNFGGSMGPFINRLIEPFTRSAADDLVTKIVEAVTGEKVDKKKKGLLGRIKGS